MPLSTVSLTMRTWYGCCQINLQYLENTQKNTSNSLLRLWWIYENLLNRSDDISIHQKHLQYLAIEVYKSLPKLNSGFMWNFFEKNHAPYNLRQGDLLFLLPAKSFCHVVNSLGCRGSLLWSNLAPQIKESQTLEEFKNRIKNLRSIHCTCTVCR